VPGKVPTLRKLDYLGITQEGALDEADKAEVA
jgi:hypothetical protein